MRRDRVEGEKERGEREEWIKNEGEGRATDRHKVVADVGLVCAPKHGSFELLEVANLK